MKYSNNNIIYLIKLNYNNLFEKQQFLLKIVGNTIVLCFMHTTNEISQF